MSYLLQDLIRLPLSERLKVIELALSVDERSSVGYQEEHIHYQFHQFIEDRNDLGVEQNALISKMVLIKK